MNPDGYDYTFTCGQGEAADQRPCGPLLNPATGTYR